MTEGSQAPDKLCPVLEGTRAGQPSSSAIALSSEDQAGNGLGLGGALARPSPPAPNAGSVSKPQPPSEAPPGGCPSSLSSRSLFSEHIFNTTGLDHPLGSSVLESTEL